MFESASFDLPAYLSRIGYKGSFSPDIETLRGIALAHPLAIPFENLDPYFRRTPALDIASLQRKLVHEGRGGWCFEHNLLLATALRAIGYDVSGLAARVLWNAPPDVVTPRGHMVLLVEIDGERYAVDAGFGGLTLTGPIRLEADVEQRTPHEPCRLIHDDRSSAGRGEAFIMQALVRGEWKSLYRFDLHRQALADYEVTNWYLSTHPRSHFLAGIIAAKAEPGKRYALRHNELNIHHLDGYTEHRLLTSAADFRETLTGLFGLRVPPGDDVDAAFERLASSTIPV